MLVHWLLSPKHNRSFRSHTSRRRAKHFVPRVPADLAPAAEILEDRLMLSGNFFIWHQDNAPDIQIVPTSPTSFELTNLRTVTYFQTDIYEWGETGKPGELLEDVIIAPGQTVPVSLDVREGTSFFVEAYTTPLSPSHPRYQASLDISWFNISKLVIEPVLRDALTTVAAVFTPDQYATFASEVLTALKAGELAYDLNQANFLEFGQGMAKHIFANKTIITTALAKAGISITKVKLAALLLTIKLDLTIVPNTLLHLYDRLSSNGSFYQESLLLYHPDSPTWTFASNSHDNPNDLSRQSHWKDTIPVFHVGDPLRFGMRVESGVQSLNDVYVQTLLFGPDGTVFERNVPWGEDGFNIHWERGTFQGVSHTDVPRHIAHWVYNAGRSQETPTRYYLARASTGKDYIGGLYHIEATLFTGGSPLEGGQLVLQNTQWIRLVDDVAPGPPVGVAGKWLGDHVALSWEAPPADFDISHFIVDRYASADATTAERTFVVENEDSTAQFPPMPMPIFVDETAPSDRPSFYEVRAVDWADLGGAPSARVPVHPIAAPELSLTSAPPIVEGEQQNVRFTVSLSSPADHDVRVDYSTSNGSAKRDEDFQATYGTVRFAAGETTQTIDVRVYDDAREEDMEMFYVNLENAVGAEISSGQATALIMDNDSSGSQLPDIWVEDPVRMPEGNSGHYLVRFKVVLSDRVEYGQIVKFDYATANGKAEDGDTDGDYSRLAGTQQFWVGDDSRFFDVRIYGDEKFELDEDFYFNIFNVVGARAVDPTGYAVILNDDPVPQFSIDSPTGSEAAGSIMFTVSKTGMTDQTAVVDYAAVPDTATMPADYDAGIDPLRGQLVFAPQETIKTILLTVAGDSVAERTEHFVVNLSNAHNATISRSKGIGTILDDDWPTVSVYAYDPNASERGDDGSFRVTRTGSTVDPLTVYYGIGGTAENGVDYETLPDAVTIPSGASWVDVMVTAKSDLEPDCPEDVILTLQSDLAYNIGSSNTAMVTITEVEGAAIGDFVWLDVNENGVQDNGELGVENVNVQLFDAGADGQVGGGDDVQVGAAQMTDANGKYLFPEVVAGTYYVRVSAPQNHTFTQKDAGTDDTKDSDADPATGIIGPFAFDGITADMTRDAGLVGTLAFHESFALGSLDQWTGDVSGFSDSMEAARRTGLGWRDIYHAASYQATALDVRFEVVPAGSGGPNSTMRFKFLSSTEDRDAGGLGYGIDVRAGIGIQLHRFDENTETVLLQSSDAIQSGRRYDIHVVRDDAGVFTLYLDDVDQGSVTDTTYTQSNFVVVASDAKDAQIDEITITVNDVNARPVLDAIGDKRLDEQTRLMFTVTASDPNDDPANGLTLSVAGLPAGATFDSTTGIFDWTPTESQQGTYHVTFTVTDDGAPPLSDSEEITITVNEVNAPPVLDTIGDKSVDEQTRLMFTVTAGDPNDDPANGLTLNAAGLPVGATFNSTTGVFDWTPTESQQGTYHVTFTVTDDGAPRLSDSKQITITVNVIPKRDVIGVYRRSSWDLDLNGNGVQGFGEANKWSYGIADGIPIVGDWNSDDLDDPGVYDPSRKGFWLDVDGDRVKDANEFFTFNDSRLDGISGYDLTPVAGDWNGDGRDDIGYYASGYWLRDMNGNRRLDTTEWIVAYGAAGLEPAPGDWNGDGDTDFGVYAPTGAYAGKWATDINENERLESAEIIDWGIAGTGFTPAIGDWDNDRNDDLGVYVTSGPYTGYWAKDINDNKRWDASDQTTIKKFGSTGDLPVVGHWASSSALRLASASTSLADSSVELTQVDLQPIVETAISLWVDSVEGRGSRVEGLETAGGVISESGSAIGSHVILDRLQSVTVSIADLPGAYLAIASPSGVLIDVNAAGQGWFIDPTPLQNEEFMAGGDDGAVGGVGMAGSRVDLLTVVSHELGHVLGLGHDAHASLMNPELPVGARRTLQPDLIDAAFASGWDDFLLE